MLTMKRHQIPARAGGRQLDLVDLRRVARVQQLLQMHGGEIGHADGTHQPRLAQLDHALEGLHIAVLRRVGPVDQQQIHIVHAQALQARLAGGARAFHAVPFLVELGGDEHLLARHARLAQALPHAHFVAIVLGRVDVPVSQPKRLGDGRYRLVIGHRPGAQADLRDTRCAIQRNGGRTQLFVRHMCLAFSSGGECRHSQRRDIDC
ncbi:hypothetical protein SDC9_180199 [bioreactor metagenome]|uniref:Uncharacterized protein n=1 Tax=bioreactor metagenome TaxID=1076179 RepID=A0A645H3Z1_9ZZZZ